MSATAAFTVSSTTTGLGTNLTSCPRSSVRRFATGARESSGFGSPFGLPRCEQRMIFPPSAISFLIVGRAATRRFSSVILPSCRGTLKSHLTRTLWPFTLISSTDFLFNPMLIFLQIHKKWARSKSDRTLTESICVIAKCNNLLHTLTYRLN